MITPKDIENKTMSPEKRKSAKNDYFAFYVGRPLSYILTIPFLYTNISPNAVSLISIIPIIIGFALMCIGNTRAVLIVGWLMFFLWNLLDGVDGNIARYKRQFSKMGSVYDAMSGYIAMVLSFFGWGVAAAHNPGLFQNIVQLPLDSYIVPGALSGIFVIFPRFDGWHDIVWAYAKQFNIDKLKWIVSGESTGQESIRNGVYNLEGKVNPDDTVIIHDGIRPLVEPSVLTDVISKCHQYGNAVTSMPYNEQIFVVDKEDEATTTQYIPRETLRRVSTPQAYKFDLLDRKYHEAFEKEIGIYGSSYTNTMMVELGERLYFAAGSDKNIKLTTKDDLEMFKAYLKADKDSWLK